MADDPDKRGRREFYSRVGAVSGVLLLCVACAAGLPLLMQYYVLPNWTNVENRCGLNSELRLSCAGIIATEPITQEVCEAAGCCWVSSDNASESCYHKFPAALSYRLDHDGDSKNLSLNLHAEYGVNESLLRDVVKRLVVKTQMWSNHHVQVCLADASAENQDSICKHPDKDHNSSNVFSESSSPEYLVKYGDSTDMPGLDEPFYLKIQRRRANNRTLFNTKIGALLITKDELELTTILPSRNLYGLGLTSSTSLRHRIPSKWTLMNRISSGEDGHGWPGVHPFYLCVESDGKAHGVLLDTKSIIRVETTRYPTVTFNILNTSSLSMHVFLGPTPADVIKQMTGFVGRPQLPPVWALGFHICRYDLRKSYEIISELRKKGVPHESDCVSSRFTSEIPFAPAVSDDDEAEWKNVTSLLRQQGQKLLLVHTPHVPLIETYKDYSYHPYVTAKRDMILMEDEGNTVRTTPLDSAANLSYGVVDVFSERYPNWVSENYKTEYGKTNFDGILLDQNTPVDVSRPEPTNKYKDPPPYETRCRNNSVNFPFVDFGPELLFKNTLCMDLQHRNATTLHYSLHNTYGLRNTQVVTKSVAGITGNGSSRMFYASTSTHTGSGAYGGHFGSGYKATWTMLQSSLVHMLEMSLYGIPMYGSAVCGSEGEPSYDLCSRWYQLSALASFMFTNRRAGQTLVDPYSLTYIRDVARHNIQIRYTLLDYMHTQLMLFSTTGEPFLRPVFFEFPTDRTAWRLTRQFFMGSALMVAPVVTPDTSLVKVYFPGDRFYDFFTRQEMSVNATDRWLGVLASEYQVALFIRAGHIVPVRRPNVTVALTQDNPFSLVVATKKAAKSEPLAKGMVYIDDGISIESSFMAEISFQKEPYTMDNPTKTYTLEILPKQSTPPGKVNVSVQKLVILGLGFHVPPTKISVDDCLISKNSYVHKFKTDSLIVSNLTQCDVSLGSKSKIKIVYL